MRNDPYKSLIDVLDLEDNPFFKPKSSATKPEPAEPQLPLTQYSLLERAIQDVKDIEAEKRADSKKQIPKDLSKLEQEQWQAVQDSVQESIDIPIKWEEPEFLPPSGIKMPKNDNFVDPVDSDEEDEVGVEQALSQPTSKSVEEMAKDDVLLQQFLADFVKDDAENNTNTMGTPMSKSTELAAPTNLLDGLFIQDPHSVAGDDDDNVDVDVVDGDGVDVVGVDGVAQYVSLTATTKQPPHLSTSPQRNNDTDIVQKGLYCESTQPLPGTELYPGEAMYDETHLHPVQPKHVCLDYVDISASLTKSTAIVETVETIEMVDSIETVEVVTSIPHAPKVEEIDPAEIDACQQQQQQQQQQHHHQPQPHSQPRSQLHHNVTNNVAVEDIENHLEVDVDCIPLSDGRSGMWMEEAVPFTLDDDFDYDKIVLTKPDPEDMMKMKMMMGMPK